MGRPAAAPRPSGEEAIITVALAKTATNLLGRERHWRRRVGRSHDSNSTSKDWEASSCGWGRMDRICLQHAVHSVCVSG